MTDRPLGGRGPSPPSLGHVQTHVLPWRKPPPPPPVLPTCSGCRLRPSRLSLTPAWGKPGLAHLPLLTAAQQGPLHTCSSRTFDSNRRPGYQVHTESSHELSAPPTVDTVHGDPPGAQRERPPESLLCVGGLHTLSSAHQAPADPGALAANRGLSSAFLTGSWGHVCCWFWRRLWQARVFPLQPKRLRCTK